MSDNFSEKTIGYQLNKGAQMLETAGIDNARAEVRFLLSEVTNLTPVVLYAMLSNELDDVTIMRYKRLLKKRATHYPLQYIIGKTYFMDMKFICREKVLIPRNDTENVVTCALDNSPEKNISVLDMCTGSGCIGIAYYVWRRKDGFDDDVVLADISEDALELAKENAIQNRARVSILHSNLFNSLKDENGKATRKFDMILCNPPYIKSADINYLMKDVRDYEPRLALDGQRDGLAFYRAVSQEAPMFLKRGGMLIFEIGYDQYMDVAKLMKDNGFKSVKKLRDMSDLDRVVYGHL